MYDCSFMSQVSALQCYISYLITFISLYDIGFGSPDKKLIFPYLTYAIGYLRGPGY